MKNKHSLRASIRAASVAGLLLLTLYGTVRGAIEPPEVLYEKKPPLKKAHRQVMNLLVDTYSQTDWSQVADHLSAYPDDAGNPNIMVIPISLGNVFLNRYEATGENLHYESALQHFESVAMKYKLWRTRWLTPAVVNYLVVSVNRLRNECDAYTELPPVQRKRTRWLWKKVMTILKGEAEYRLMLELPYAPYYSCSTGDSKAEENAWEASLFAAAANFLPDDPQAAVWDEKARQLAYNSITRPSDPPDKRGVKTCTVGEDWTLPNHGLMPNPYYAGATLLMLAEGALTYRLTGRAIPEEFTHNIQEFHEKYKSYLGTDLTWTVPADPDGDGTLFPMVFDSELEKEILVRKALQGYLWKPTKPVAVMGTGGDLWEAVQNSKVVLYYLMGSYLWHFAAPSACPDVRYTMPQETEEQ